MDIEIIITDLHNLIHEFTVDNINRVVVRNYVTKVERELQNIKDSSNVYTLWRGKVCSLLSIIRKELFGGNLINIRDLVLEHKDYYAVYVQ